MSVRAVFASFILLLSVDLIAAPQKYVWHHPWFNKDMFSDQPPPWPYEVIEERNGVTRVKVTPPEQPAKPPAPAAVVDPSPPAPSPAPAPTSPPATISQPAPTTTSSAAIKTMCATFGPVARATVQVKAKGVPQAMAESAVVPKDATPAVAEILKSVVRSVYKHRWTESEAEEIVIQACLITYGK